MTLRGDHPRGAEGAQVSARLVVVVGRSSAVGDHGMHGGGKHVHRRHHAQLQRDVGLFGSGVHGAKPCVAGAEVRCQQLRVPLISAEEIGLVPVAVTEGNISTPAVT